MNGCLGKEIGAMYQLQPLEYQNQRILTTAQLATAYRTSEKRISENFNRNQDHYIYRKHFYHLTGEDLRTFKETNTQIAECFKQASAVYLWTEKGAWLHAKSLNTDRAWEAYEKLVDDYFQIKAMPAPQYHLPQTYTEALRMLADEVEQREQIQQQAQLMAPKAKQFDAFMSAENAQTVNEAAKILKQGPNKLFRLLREQHIFMQNNLPYQKYIDRNYFDVRETTIQRGDEVFGYAQTLFGVMNGAVTSARCFSWRHRDVREVASYPLLHPGNG